MIVADLFAGVGGMSEGFKMAGIFEIAFAVEFDKDIAFAYQMNHHVDHKVLMYMLQIYAVSMLRNSTRSIQELM